jgi:hypothetical protein
VATHLLILVYLVLRARIHDVRMDDIVELLPLVPTRIQILLLLICSALSLNCALALLLIRFALLLLGTCCFLLVYFLNCFYNFVLFGFVHPLVLFINSN